MLKLTALERPLPEYFVYYDEWSGEIKDITNKVKESADPYLKTEDKIASDLMLGHINPKKYIVADLADGTFIVKKTEVLRIKETEDELTKIPLVSHSVDSDINVILYLNNWKMEVNINQDTMYRLTGKRFNKKFGKEDNINGSVLNLYIIKRNNPNYLIKMITIDPIDLMNEGFKLFDLSDLQTKISLNEVDILTRRVFKNYGLKVKKNYVTVDYHTRKSQKRIHTTINEASKDFATFSISQSTEGWIIKSNFDDPTEQKIYRDLTIYLTEDNPNVLLDKIKIPFNKIGWQKEFIVKTFVDPTTCKLLMDEAGKKITFKVEGLEYVKPGKY